MIKPKIIPVTLYDLDDFDFQANWKEKCGATFDLTAHNARWTFWPSETDRSGNIYQITNPQVSGNGIALDDTSPNIWAHIIDTNVDFSANPPGWYIFELQTPAGADPAVDGVWFRLYMGPVTYVL